MSDVRLLQALNRLREDLPRLCGERWPEVRQQLSALLDEYERAGDEEERARVALAIQDVIEACSSEAARRLYEEMTRPARESDLSPQEMLVRLRTYFPPGWPVVPPVRYVCPVSGCGYETYVTEPADAGECPTHHVPLVRADGEGPSEGSADKEG